MDSADTRHGFSLIRREHVAEIDADVEIRRHDSTGAQLICIPAEDDNKTFLIAFNTPPEDDTGVAHILEHSVLNGSRRFPVKEPFAELLKASLYTFLNAMTYADRTVYPVASRNAADFHNLVDVYLDAVFDPLLSRETFMQEGWHYDLDEPDGELSYSGVVYNEMLGATSGAERILGDELDRALFPDSTYGRHSGGDPEAIPTLSYAQFRAFHRRYYHPSNARIVVYGDFDPDTTLAQIAGYLDRYDAQDPADHARIIPQPRWDAPREASIPYPISADESTAEKAYVMRAWMLQGATDPEGYLAAQILEQILVGNQAAPLHKALIDSHLGHDVMDWGAQQDYLCPFFAVGMRGTEAERLPEIAAVIDHTLADLADHGIPAKNVEAAINSVEFRLREANYGGYSKGLIYALNMMDSWTYGGDPLAHLRYEDTLAAIKLQADAGGYFEGLIRQHFLENPHRLTLTLTPDKDYEERRQARLAERLSVQHAAMDAATRREIIADCEALEELQHTPDSPEALATIPTLPLSSVRREPDDFPFAIVLPGGADAPILSHSDLHTRGIAYLKLSFDARGLDAELLSLLPLFGRYTMQCGTTRRDFVDLSREIDIHTGGIGPGTAHSARMYQPDAVQSSFGYNAKALTTKIPVLFDLLTELITSADFHQVHRLLEVARASRARIQSGFVSSGHSYAVSRLAAYTTRLGRFSEATGGLSQYYAIDALVKQLERDPEPVVDTLERLRAEVLRRGNLHVHLTGGQAELDAVQRALGSLGEALPAGASTPVDPQFSPILPNEGLVVPSKVQYVGKAANLYDCGYTHTGAFEILSKWLNRDFLWQQVRVQGNAYGCFARLSSLTGEFYCCSYRDPHLERTLGIFDAIGDAIARLDLSPGELEKLQIGTMGNVDAPMSADQKGATAFNHYKLGIDYDYRQQRRDEILQATPAVIKAQADYLREFGRRGHICVVGGAEAINAAKGRFASIRSVFADQ